MTEVILCEYVEGRWNPNGPVAPREPKRYRAELYWSTPAPRFQAFTFDSYNGARLLVALARFISGASRVVLVDTQASDGSGAPQHDPGSNLENPDGRNEP